MRFAVIRRRIFTSIHVVTSEEKFSFMKALRVISSFLASALVVSLATVAVAQSAPAKTAAAPKAPAAPAVAEAPKAPEPPVPTLVAIIPFQQAAFQTEEGQRAIGELKKKYEPKQQALKTLAEEIQSLEKQLADPAAKFTDAEKAERKKAIETKKAHFQREAQAGQAESQKDFAAIWKPLAEKFFNTMVAEAKERGVGVIVDGGSEQHPVLWVSDSLKPLDLTTFAIDRYNKNPAAAPEAAAPAAPAAPAEGAVTK
jgi:outer membrane protein